MLADGIELVDGGAGAQEEIGGLAQFGETDPDCRGRQQRRSAAGEAGDDQVALAGRREDRVDAGGGLHPAFVGYRVGGLDDLDPAGRLAVPVFDDDETAGHPLAERGFDRAGHARRSLAGADHRHRIEIGKVVALVAGQQGVAVDPQQASNRRGRVGGGEGGVDHPTEAGAGCQPD